MGAWKASKSIDLDRYIDKILDENRLKSRVNIFTKYTLPCIDLACDKLRLQHVVVASDMLPDWCKADLQAAIKNRPWLSIEYIGFDERFDINGIIEGSVFSWWKKEGCFSSKPIDCPVAVVRLDDDDILSPDYFHMLSRYLQSEYRGMCVSMPRGYFGLWDGNKYISFSQSNNPKNASGLAYVSSYSGYDRRFSTAYCYPPGSDANVDTLVPTILDGRSNVYIRTMSGENDGFATPDGYIFGSNIEEIRQRYFKNPIDPSIFRDSFSLPFSAE